MSVLTADINIDTTPFASTKPLPNTPIPLTCGSTNLSPDTQLQIPLSSASGTNKPQQLSNLADAMETARSNLNQVLTTWKDWAGKEDLTSSTDADDVNEDDQEVGDDEEE
ncbi:uncharacterized protein UTRI_01011_B [Ustilago trichophora]|uniref:EKC/KEOPS complex subunit GON7 n=1 Tax=Ustilago trichophora TaxID=86804 RepID=A0A5C3DSX0_9BASI|nr:uncharacterized protein UTRI_01011_B [Ustilago trichophora]